MCYSHQIFAATHNFAYKMGTSKSNPLPWRGGVAQWTSHPPQEREDPGTRFLGKHSSAVVYIQNDLICSVCVLKGEIKAFATKIFVFKSNPE
jgi:hypothetical protein